MVRVVGLMDGSGFFVLGFLVLFLDLDKFIAKMLDVVNRLGFLML